MRSEKGQSLLELVVSMAIAILVLSSLAFAIITSLRNAQFANRQIQSTKLAQDALEKVRSLRDRSGEIGGSFTLEGNLIDSWSDPDLWTNQISSSCTPNCYFKFSGPDFQYLGAGSDIPNNAEDSLGNGIFKRVVILSDDEITYQTQKKITAVVKWDDAAGPHESRLTTILGKEL